MWSAFTCSVAVTHCILTVQCSLFRIWFIMRITSIRNFWWRHRRFADWRSQKHSIHNIYCFSCYSKWGARDSPNCLNVCIKRIVNHLDATPIVVSCVFKTQKPLSLSAGVLKAISQANCCQQALHVLMNVLNTFHLKAALHFVSVFEVTGTFWTCLTWWFRWITWSVLERTKSIFHSPDQLRSVPVVSCDCRSVVR